MSRPRITVIGVGDGAPDTLGPRYRRLAAKADLLAGGRRLLDLFPDSKAERLVIGSDLAGVVEALREALAARRQVVVLASGDPLLFGIGATLVRELGPESVDIHPGSSSVQHLFARAGVAWHDATILSAHGRPLTDIIPGALAARTAAILTDGIATPSAIAAALLEAGMESCRAIVGERLGSREERVVETTLAGMAGQTFDPLNVLLLLRECAAPRLAFGLPDDDFVCVRGQITKAEVRAVTLSKLRLPPFGVLWDVGAGSGALAIEAARLMPRGHVYAVERDPEQLDCLRTNALRHGAGNVCVVPGEAPDALAGLPHADAIFLGGSGGRLSDLLNALAPPLVANFAVLEHVHMVLERFPRADVLQLSAARSQSIGDGRRLAAMNPVFIVSVPA